MLNTNVNFTQQCFTIIRDKNMWTVWLFWTLWFNYLFGFWKFFIKKKSELSQLYMSWTLFQLYQKYLLKVWIWGKPPPYPPPPPFIQNPYVTFFMQTSLEEFISEWDENHGSLFSNKNSLSNFIKTKRFVYKNGVRDPHKCLQALLARLQDFPCLVEAKTEA